MIINRVWAMPNKWTFTIKPIAELLARYVGDGKGWIDPFAGENSPAEFTNDINTDRDTRYHLDAEVFCNQIEGVFKGILFDPPYSYTQIKQCYEGLGIPVHADDVNERFYNRVKDAITDKVIQGGYCLNFGWNSNGMCKKRGYEIIEILLVSHGGHHNDTIVTVERKLQDRLIGDKEKGC